MRDMSEQKRLEAAKWAVAQRERLAKLREQRYGQLRDELVVVSANDCQGEAQGGSLGQG